MLGDEMCLSYGIMHNIFAVRIIIDLNEMWLLVNSRSIVFERKSLGRVTNDVLENQLKSLPAPFACGP